MKVASQSASGISTKAESPGIGIVTSRETLGPSLGPSVASRDLLIETIRKNVMAWTRLNLLTIKFNHPGRV